MLNRTHNQLGSAVSFVIIAVVLVIVTAGAIYFVGQRGDQARKDEASKTAEQPSLSPSVISDAQPAATTPKEADASTASAPTSNSGENLPTTGIELDIFRYIALGTIVWSGTAFVLSRVNLRRSL